MEMPSAEPKKTKGPDQTPMERAQSVLKNLEPANMLRYAFKNLGEVGEVGDMATRFNRAVDILESRSRPSNVNENIRMNAKADMKYMQEIFFNYGEKRKSEEYRKRRLADLNSVIDSVLKT